MKTQLRHIIGIIAAVILAILDIILWRDTMLWVPVLVLAVTIAWFQYWLDFFKENHRQKQIEEKFPDFVRNLVGAIKSGMPVSKAITYVSDTDYGPLSPYIKKLAYKIEWGIPMHKALLSFADSTGNKIIRRAVSTVIEAETSGGNLEDVLDSITNSLFSIKKIKEKRKALIHTHVVQSYIIFFVFLGVMIVIQNMLIPYIMELQGTSITGEPLSIGQASGVVQNVVIEFSSLGMFLNTLGRWFVSLYGVFLMLALIQGFFAGLVIGKLSEGKMKFGVKHSLILMSVAFFVISFAQGF